MTQQAAQLVVVVGPTAAGKSALALDLATALRAEIVNADAMALYRGMDIGTAKLPPEQRRGITHHLLDVWDIGERASVADYQRRARSVVDGLLAGGRSVVVVGGSGLYVQALLDELVIPPTDPQVRLRLEADLAAAGSEAVHARLAAVDPAAAAAIQPTNARRVVRALEVVELTGQPFSAQLPSGRRHYEHAVVVGLDATELDARIEARTQRMYAEGLVAETERLAAAGLANAPTAGKALGYAQVLDLLAGRLADVAAAQAATVRATRRFARRQRSWFRRDGSVHWLDASAPDLAGPALRLVRGGGGPGQAGAI